MKCKHECETCVREEIKKLQLKIAELTKKLPAQQIIVIQNQPYIQYNYHYCNWGHLNCYTIHYFPTTSLQYQYNLAQGGNTLLNSQAGLTYNLSSAAQCNTITYSSTSGLSYTVLNNDNTEDPPEEGETVGLK
jgi:hypothetical protein